MILSDAVIPFHPKDRETVQMCCNSLRNVMGVSRIFLITSENPNIENTVFVNEKEITSIVSLNEIRTKWETTGSRFANRAGWIYQQLLKLGASQLIPDLSTDFLISDSDIIFLNNPYSHVENGIFPYSKAYSGEYNEPYRKNYERLLKEPTESGFSFINHNMVFNKNNIQDLKKFIEDKNDERWDHAIISALDFHSFSDFSEYDLYGNWMFKYRKDRMQKVDIRIRDIKVVPNDREIQSAKSSGYHILSSQAWNR
jgi:hypothetical protein